MNIRWEKQNSPSFWHDECHKFFLDDECVAIIWNHDEDNSIEARILDWRDDIWMPLFQSQGVSIQEAKRLCEKEVVHAIARKICEGDL